MERQPNVISGYKGIQFGIIHFKEAALLKVGRADAPSTAKIAIYTITNYPSEGLVYRIATKPNQWVCRIRLEGKRQCGRNLLADVLIPEALCSGLLGGIVDGPSQKGDLNEVV